MGNWSVIVTVCHLIAGIPTPVCHQEIAVRGIDRTQACNLAQAGLAQWKANSRFADDEWTIGGYICTPDTQADAAIRGRT